MYKPSQYNNFFNEGDSIFLFNSFSKACLKIKNKELERVKKLLKTDCPCKIEDRDYQELLIENGFILSDEIDELKMLEYLYHANYFSTDKVTIALVPTLRCNFKCPYCFETGSRGNNNEVKEYFPILKRFSDKNFRNKREVHISLFGGEPLLKKDEVISYLDYLFTQSKKYNYKLSTNLVTNGFLLDNVTVKALLKYNCSSIQVTLDGNIKTHNKLRVLHNNEGTFDRIIKNFVNAIKLATKMGSNTQFILRVNLLNQEIDDIQSILCLFDKNIRKNINILFRPIYETDCFKKYNINNVFDLKRFYDEAKKEGFSIVKSTYYLQYCESDGGINFFYVTPELKVWKCINQSIKTAEIGCIDKTGTLKINHTNLSRWYNSSNPFNDEKCKSCYYLPVCYGGCPLYHLKTGNRKCTTKDIAITPYFY